MRTVGSWASFHFVLLYLLAGFGVPFFLCFANQARIVLLWPDEGQLFRSGTGILAAFTTAGFDPPAQGYIELLVNGNPTANLTPAALDGEGNRRVHLVLPEFPEGVHSVEVRCVNNEHTVLARSGASFLVNGSEITGSSKADMIMNPPSSLCLPVGFCGEDSECGHGHCSEGACICEGNWEGEMCDHSILENARYLPEVLPSLSPSFCHKSRGWENLTHLLLEDLQSLHSPDWCEIDSNVMWFDAPHHGLGGNMHILTVALTHALAHRKAMGVKGRWLYGSHQSCTRSSGLSCYFLPHSPCTLFVGEHAEINEDQPLLREVEPEWMWARREPDRPPANTNPHHVDNAADNPLWLYRNRGILWWRSQLLSFLMTPNQALAARLRQVKNLIGYRHPIIGVHIRHGDACTHASLSSYRPPCKGFQDYFEEVERVRQRFDIHRVFLASDDASAVEYARAVHRDVELVYLNVERREFASNWFIEYRLAAAVESQAAVDRALLADSAVFDLMLLAHADVLIGAFSSHLSRLALELSAGVKGHVPPYVSLDWPYGMHGIMPPYANRQIYN